MDLTCKIYKNVFSLTHAHLQLHASADPHYPTK